VAVAGRWIGGPSYPGASPLALTVLAACGLAVLALLALALRRGPELVPRALAAAWGGIWAFAVANAFAGWVRVSGYGDAGFLAAWLEQGRGPFPRWLAGSAVLEWLDVGVWRSPFLAGVVPEGRPGTQLLVAVAGATVAAVCAVGVAVPAARRLPIAVVLTTCSPIFLMLALGYDEIYPVIAGPFLLALFWLFSRPLEQSDGFLAILYVPFAPFSAVAGVTIALLVPHRARPMLATGAATVVGGIAVCWPHGVSHFLRSLYTTLNLGEANTLFERYRGHAAGPSSLTFAWPYALSWEHLRDVGFMWFWSGALPVLVAALIAGALLSRLRHGRGRAAVRTPIDRRVWLALAIVAQQAWWALLMIPKLGPREDVDLFFSAYLTAAFFVGVLLDRRLRRSPRAASDALLVAAAALGASAASLAFLAVASIPKVS